VRAASDNGVGRVTDGAQIVAVRRSFADFRYPEHE
jgi:hypothetical protein